MKVTQRQPICITRLRKKNSDGPLRTREGSRAHLQDLPANTLPEYAQKDSGQGHNDKAGEDLRATSTSLRGDLAMAAGRGKENETQAETVAWAQQKQQLLNKIRQLQQANSSLGCRNMQLVQQIQRCSIERQILDQRVNLMEANLQGLCEQYQKQFKPPFNKNYQQVQLGSTSIKNDCEAIPKNTSDLYSGSPRARQSALSKSVTGSEAPMSLVARRMSFYQTTGLYQSQSHSSKAREYKNQLETEKLRRLNLERELSATKENVRLEFRNQLECLERRLGQMREGLLRKDKQIQEKQGIINRFIARK